MFPEEPHLIDRPLDWEVFQYEIGSLSLYYKPRTKNQSYMKKNDCAYNEKHYSSSTKQIYKKLYHEN